MKLAEHVSELRKLIENSFDKKFARLGFGKTKSLDVDMLPDDLKAKHQRFKLMIENHISETGDYVQAREKLLDELTFTLFNRLAAIKVMEAAKLFPPILTKQHEHGDRSFGHKAWLEINTHMRQEELEGIRDYIKSAFNELGKTLPLYSKDYPYAMLPDAISLNDIIDTLNAFEQDLQVGQEIWQSDDILGWLYESYNNNKKELHKASKEKTEYHKVSLQSQVYTPQWVVQFLVENSLGKMYLEMYPNSEIKTRYKIANIPEQQTRTPKPLHEIKIIDPACGSGNFLLYAFDFFYELYLDQIENFNADYDEKQIAKLIIENNLHGIDLDDRAVQLAQLGLFIKAKKKRRSIGELNFKVVSSDFYLPSYDEVKHIFENGGDLDKNHKDLIEKVWGNLQFAYKFGSLVQIDEQINQRLQAIEKKVSEDLDLFAAADEVEHKNFAERFFVNLKQAVEQYAKTNNDTFLSSKTRDAIVFLELITSKYDVATANPPYTDSSEFGPDLKKFIDANYKQPYKFNTNLYGTFIKRCYELTEEIGLIAMIHPRTFMFIKSFEDVRKFILGKTKINVFVDYSLSNLFGSVMVDPAFYVLEKNKEKEKKSWFISLDQYTRTPNEKYKKEFCLSALNDYIDGKYNKHNFILEQSKITTISSYPFIYWISDEFRESFSLTSLDKVASICKGMDTSFNLRFLKFWWEVGINKPTGDWKPYAKGGPFNKWYGNMWAVINWENNGEKIKNYPGSTIRNERFFFSEGLTYSTSGSKGASFRYLPEGAIFDAGGNGIFVKNNKDIDLFYLLGFINSSLSFYIRDCLNPTVNTTVGDLNRLPIVTDSISKIIHDLVKECIDLKIKLCTYSLVEFNYSSSPFLSFKKDANLNIVLKNYLNFENHINSRILISEAIINNEIMGIYGLTEHDVVTVLEKEGESVGGLAIFEDARKEYLDSGSADNLISEEVKKFINNLPIIEDDKEIRLSLEKEFESLYQTNNNLENFCIRHQINPINIWYLFKNSNILPEQRVQILAMEFLTDLIREILLDDEDGIVPLVPNAGEKVLLDRIEAKFYEKGYSTAQYSSFDKLLGRPLNEYLNKKFFADLSDHLNLFMYLPKTPFIWHLTSGPEQGFDCFIIIYKWSRDKLMRLRSVYIENRERALQNRQSDLAENNSAEAQSEKDRIFKQLKEIEQFKKKIDELLAEGYDPILDDGVGKNIAPLQKKKMLSYEVLNAGQLKKYLNADW